MNTIPSFDELSNEKSTSIADDGLGRTRVRQRHRNDAPDLGDRDGATRRARRLADQLDAVSFELVRSRDQPLKTPPR